jgi:hypothetical protein
MEPKANKETERQCIVMCLCRPWVSECRSVGERLSTKKIELKSLKCLLKGIHWSLESRDRFVCFETRRNKVIVENEVECDNVPPPWWCSFESLEERKALSLFRSVEQGGGITHTPLSSL